MAIPTITMDDDLDQQMLKGCLIKYTRYGFQNTAIYNPEFWKDAQIACRSGHLATFKFFLHSADYQALREITETVAELAAKFGGRHLWLLDYLVEYSIYLDPDGDVKHLCHLFHVLSLHNHFDQMARIISLSRCLGAIDYELGKAIVAAAKRGDLTCALFILDHTPVFSLELITHVFKTGHTGLVKYLVKLAPKSITDSVIKRSKRPNDILNDYVGKVVLRDFAMWTAANLEYYKYIDELFGLDDRLLTPGPAGMRLKTELFRALTRSGNLEILDYFLSKYFSDGGADAFFESDIMGYLHDNELERKVVMWVAERFVGLISKHSDKLGSLSKLKDDIIDQCEYFSPEFFTKFVEVLLPNRDERLNCFLHLAAQDRVDYLKLMIEHGWVDAEFYDRGAHTAAIQGAIDAFEYCVASGANLDEDALAEMFGLGCFNVEIVKVYLDQDCIESGLYYIDDFMSYGDDSFEVFRLFLERGCFNLYQLDFTLSDWLSRVGPYSWSVKCIELMVSHGFRIGDANQIVSCFGEHSRQLNSYSFDLFFQMLKYIFTHVCPDHKDAMLRVLLGVPVVKLENFACRDGSRYLSELRLCKVSDGADVMPFIRFLLEIGARPNWAEVRLQLADICNFTFAMLLQYGATVSCDDIGINLRVYGFSRHFYYSCLLRRSLSRLVSEYVWAPWGRKSLEFLELWHEYGDIDFPESMAKSLREKRNQLVELLLDRGDVDRASLPLVVPYPGGSGGPGFSIASPLERPLNLRQHLYRLPTKMLQDLVG